MECYYHSSSCQEETRPSLSDEDIDRGNKSRELNDLRHEYIRKKNTKSKEKKRIKSDLTYPTKDLSLPIFLLEQK